MKPEDDNLDVLRKAWADMGKILDNSAPEITTPSKNDKMKTALDRLSEKYKRFSIFSIVMIFTSSLLFSRPGMLTPPWNIYLPAIYAVYFFITFAVDYWLHTGIKSIDPLTMSISQVVEKSLLYKKRHMQFMMLLLPVAISVLAVTAYAFSYDSYVLLGMLVGALVGLAIGIMQFCRFMAYYREISE